jgi:hypothetical protein
MFTNDRDFINDVNKCNIVYSKPTGPYLPAYQNRRYKPVSFLTRVFY